VRSITSVSGDAVPSFDVGRKTKSRQGVLLEGEEREEALQAAVVGRLGPDRVEHGRECGQAHAAHADEGQHERGEAAEAGAVPGEVGLQQSHQGRNVGHGTGSISKCFGFGHHKGKCSERSVPTCFYRFVVY